MANQEKDFSQEVVAVRNGTFIMEYVMKAERHHQEGVQALLKTKYYDVCMKMKLS